MLLFCGAGLGSGSDGPSRGPVVGEGTERRGMGLRGDAGFGSLQAGGDSLVALALLVGLGPGQALGLGGDGDCAGVLDQVEGVFDFCFGLGRFGLGFGGDAVAAGFLELVEAALGSVGFAAEADRTAAEAEDFCQRHVGGGGLAERLERVEAEAYDVGGETEFVLGLGVVSGEHLGRGLAGSGDVAGGAHEEESRRGGSGRFPGRRRASVLARDMGGGLGLSFDVCSQRTIGGCSLECKNKFFGSPSRQPNIW